jgi:hypothetical protein
LEDNDGGKAAGIIYLEYFANNQGKKPVVPVEPMVLPRDDY